MLARTRLEWVLDFALAQIGAVPAPIYPSSTAAECCYILEHANVVGCFVEDDELLAKIEAARRQHVYTIETLPELARSAASMLPPIPTRSSGHVSRSATTTSSPSSTRPARPAHPRAA